MKHNKVIGETPGDVGARPENIQKFDKENTSIMGKIAIVVFALIAIAIVIMFFT